MNIITDRNKAPKNLHYNVSNNLGDINVNFGKNQTEAYKFAESMNETAIVRGWYYYKDRGKWAKCTIFIDHVFR